MNLILRVRITPMGIASRSQHSAGARQIILLTQLAAWKLMESGTSSRAGSEVQWLACPTPRGSDQQRQNWSRASLPPHGPILQQPPALGSGSFPSWANPM